LNLVPEESLRRALHPFRADPARFEAGVLERLEALERRRAEEPLAEVSPWLRSAAAMLPVPIIGGRPVAGALAKLAPATGISKLVGYLAFPAISLFALLGATVLSAVKVRGIQGENQAKFLDEAARQAAIKLWWAQHKLSAWLVYAVTMVLFFVGETWPVFVFYIVSFGLLVYLLKAYAKLGLGSRHVIGPTCACALALLGQLAVFPNVGEADIHFVDQKLIAAVFLGGSLVLFGVGIVGAQPHFMGMWTAKRFNLIPLNLLRVLSVLLFAAITLPTIAWFMSPILWPANPARIKRYVESFESAPFGGSSWHSWEIVAGWAIEKNLAPDLSGARRLLAQEIASDQNPFILGSAFRLGLVRKDQLGQLKDYVARRSSLVDQSPYIDKPQSISSIQQQDWVIRAAVLCNDLSLPERDYLEKRLLATLEEESRREYYTLVEELRVAQLLKVIGRPIDRDRHRSRVHALLRTFHSTRSGGFQLAGGFRTYLNLDTGSMKETAFAVELMEIYGIPDGLDLNWLRSFLRPTMLRQATGQEWVAAVTRDRLNHLPGAVRPTWLEFAYYERSLLAALVLVGLCLYATAISPAPRANE
jgi:hypothetical protein